MFQFFPTRTFELSVVFLLIIPMLEASPFIRGDIESDRNIQITDAMTILGFLFTGDPGIVVCEDVADVDDSGKLDITDPIYLLSYLFLGRAPPPAPFPCLGFDLTMNDGYICGDMIGGERPVQVHVPCCYNPEIPTPLVVFLHGRYADPLIPQYEQDNLDFKALADEQCFIIVTPPGSFRGGIQGWYTVNKDDTYLFSVVREMKRNFNIDENMIFFVGFSQGGAMAYWLACQNPKIMAAFVSIGGWITATPQQANCSADPVHVLEIHGTNDEVIPFLGGGSIMPAETAVRTLANFFGCSPTPKTSPNALDLELSIDGPDTTITQYAEGCVEESSAELWAINGGSHFPLCTEEFRRAVIEYLFIHRRPEK